MPSTAIQIPPRPPPVADNTAGTATTTAAEQKTRRGASKLFRRKLTGFRPDKESSRVTQELSSRREEQEEGEEDDGGVMGIMDDVDMSCSPKVEQELVSGASSQSGEDDDVLVDDDELRSSSSISSSPLNPSFASRRASLLLVSPAEPKRSSPIRRRNSTGTYNSLAAPPLSSPSNLSSTSSASIPIDNDLCPPTPQNTPSEGSTMAQLSAHGLSDTKLLAIANALHAAAGMGSAATVHATTEVSSRVKNVHWAPHVDVHSEDDWLKQLHAYRKARKRLNRWRLTALFGTTV
ncbi:hypothetical protein HDU87_006366 [Geranomyces variabilis]|uniref:Uncharacterized protein n=1 Tax=Geranomyces variabilis TaxID=109894 RepID=A0AAD5TH65_9FUNG|nr:hypothetical protein HDU87_006366 [Geranomyces variabilis]